MAMRASTRQVGTIAIVDISGRIELGEGSSVLRATVKDLVAGSGLAFADRGVHQLKGVPDPWHLYEFVS